MNPKENDNEIIELTPYALRELVKAVYVDAPDNPPTRHFYKNKKIYSFKYLIINA